LAFVSVTGASQVVGIDLDTRRVVAHISVPSGPAQIASSNDLRQLLVVSPQAGKVTLINAITRKVVNVFSGFGRPTGVAFGPGMDSVGHSWYAYVTDEQRGQLVVIDLRRLAVVSRVAVGRSPMSIVVGDLIWVTHGSGEPFVTALAVNTSAHPKIVDRIPAGGAALAAAPEADSITLGVTYVNGQVGAVDAGTHLLLWRKQLSAPVYGLAADFLNERSMWVTSPRIGTTILLSASTGRVLRTLTGCPGAHGVVPVGSAWIVVACHDSRTVAIYDTRSWQKRLVPVVLALSPPQPSSGLDQADAAAVRLPSWLALVNGWRRTQHFPKSRHEFLFFGESLWPKAPLHRQPGSCPSSARPCHLVQPRTLSMSTASQPSPSHSVRYARASA
jgi:hypothetical protein